MAKTTEDEYVVLSADETVRLVEMPARSLVHEMRREVQPGTPLEENGGALHL